MAKDLWHQCELKMKNINEPIGYDFVGPINMAITTLKPWMSI